MIELLALPALACAALVGIHAYFGLQVLKRNVIFVDLALAQVAALGATVAFMLGHAPQTLAAYAWSLAFALAAAVLLAFTRRWAGRVPQEAQIGVIYVVAAGAALLLVDRAPQGAEHIRQILIGNILTVGWEDVRNAIVLYAAVGIAHPLLARRLREGWLAEFAFYAAFALVVTSSVALAGVLLVFAFLIIPAAIGVLYAETFRRQLVVAWIVGTLTAAAGLAFSFYGDYSTGATLVCAYGVALAIAGLARLPRLLAATRWMLVAVLAGSGLLILAAPRADQPVLDALEHLVPGIRHAYMDEKALAIAADAQRYADRYRGEAESLRAREVERRWKGEPMDELELRRVASFLKSYNEMIVGETYVIREVRGRAREASRWWLGIAMLLAAALAAMAGRDVWQSARRTDNKRIAHGTPDP
jgi:zinc/manganese transport system permease protein